MSFSGQYSAEIIALNDVTVAAYAVEATVTEVSAGQNIYYKTVLEFRGDDELERLWRSRQHHRVRLELDGKRVNLDGYRQDGRPTDGVMKLVGELPHEWLYED